jgi:hypothetical protein
MTNTENAVVRPVTTNNVGQHVAPDAHLGHYPAHTEAAGFKVAEQKDINVNVGVSGSLYVVDSGEDGGSGIISIMPSFDSIAEFRALTSNYVLNTAFRPRPPRPYNSIREPSSSSFTRK